MTKILAVCGSLRANSSNSACLDAAKLLAPNGAGVSLYDGIADMPFFNPDVAEEQLPDTVRKWRNAVAISDALLFCSPEYAGGVSGVLKNALEWLVGDVAAYQKPAAVINAAPRAHHADNSLRLILTTMGIRLVEASSVSLALSGRNLDAMGIANDTRLADQLKNALTRLAAEAKRPSL